MDLGTMGPHTSDERDTACVWGQGGNVGRCLVFFFNADKSIVEVRDGGGTTASLEGPDPVKKRGLSGRPWTMNLMVVISAWIWGNWAAIMRARGAWYCCT